MFCLCGAGYALGVMNTVLDTISSDLEFDPQVGGAFVVSILLLGGAAGALGAGVFADAVGTKRAQVGGVVHHITTCDGRLFCWMKGRTAGRPHVPWEAVPHNFTNFSFLRDGGTCGALGVTGGSATLRGPTQWHHYQ